MVIVTDGQENCSKTASSVVFDKVKVQRDRFSWEFIYIGANQDAIATAAKLGIGAQYTMDYNASKIGTQSVYNALNNTISRARGGEVMCFSVEDRAAALQND